jgi:hypothetical protein
MGPWKKFESTVVRLKRSYENIGSVVCLTTKGRQLEQNFEDILKDMLEVKKVDSNFFHGPIELRESTVIVTVPFNINITDNCLYLLNTLKPITKFLKPLAIMFGFLNLVLTFLDV